MVRCYCGRTALLRISQNVTNPGRFYCCAQQRRDCGFFMWFDPPMGARSVDLITGSLISQIRDDRLQHQMRNVVRGSENINQCEFERLQQEISKKNKQIKLLLVIIGILCLMLMF